MTGASRTLTRVSTVAKAADDASNLHGYKQEMVLRGLRAGEDLRAVLATIDPEAPREKWRDLAKQAEERGAAQAAANLGTAVHSAIEAGVQGRPLSGVPEVVRRDAEAAVRTFERNRLDVLASEQFVIVDELNAAGSFDHLVRSTRGAYILDVKTSGNPDAIRYAGLSWAIQLACYAHGRPYSGPVERDRWSRPRIVDVPENYTTWPEQPNVAVGIIALVVRGSAECQLVQVDLAAGWEAAQLAVDVRSMRTRKDLARRVA